MLKDTNIPSSGYFLKSLDPITGIYSDVFNFLKSSTTPNFSGVNACAGGTQDSYLYCTIRLPDSHFVVRLDFNSKIQFVAKVSGMTQSATIDGDGDYIWYRAIGEPNAENAPGKDRKEMFIVNEIHTLRS